MNIFLDARSDDVPHNIETHTVPQDLSQEFAEETPNNSQVGSFTKYNNKSKM